MALSPITMSKPPKESLPYTGFHICPDLAARQVCFRVREYKEGLFHCVFHGHVPAHRISQDRASEALRSLIVRYAEWPGEWILNSLLNDRGGQPQRYPGFTHDVSYPESGVLRHAVSGARVHAWCDIVISKKNFRSSIEHGSSE